jgi:hypothetical protein
MSITASACRSVAPDRRSDPRSSQAVTACFYLQMACGVAGCDCERIALGQSLRSLMRFADNGMDCTASTPAVVPHRFISAASVGQSAPWFQWPVRCRPSGSRRPLTVIRRAKIVARKRSPAACGRLTRPGAAKSGSNCLDQDINGTERHAFERSHNENRNELSVV